MSGGYIAVFAVSFLTTLGLTPLVRRVALRRNLLVAPGERKVHEKPMPNLGGVAMIAGLMAGMLVAAVMGDFEDVFQSSTRPIGLVVAAAGVFPGRPLHQWAEA